MVLTIWPALFAGFHLLATRKDAHVGEAPAEHEQEGRR
jgi:hypothetical protein